MPPWNKPTHTASTQNSVAERQEKRREQRDAEIRENRDEQHALGAEFARQAAIRDSRGERHELRNQQRKHELG